MVEFSLDARSGVSPYLQLVHQVRRALRWACCPRATSCRRSRTSSPPLAINPNTVLKAYRELERDGLVAARPGRRHLRDPHARRRRCRARAAAADWTCWLAGPAGGLDDESIEALFISIFRSVF